MVSYDVTSLFNNVPLQETIDILVDKAFTEDWFNTTHNLNISKQDLQELMKVASMNQLFQFNGELYQQNDGVAMGSPLGPLLANTFLCFVEDKLRHENLLPNMYRRYVDDTFVVMNNIPSAEAFLAKLNSCHPSLKFTMDIANGNEMPTNQHWLISTFSP